jgi:hypothetical protein
MTAINADSSERFSLVLKFIFMTRTTIELFHQLGFEPARATDVKHPAL